MYKTFVYLTLITTVYGAVNFLPRVEKPVEFADQEGCFVPELNKVLPYEESYRPPNGKPCAIYTCHSNNETQIETCGNAVTDELCHLIIPHDDQINADNCCGVIVCQ